MKINLVLAVATAAIVSFASCSNENEVLGSGNGNAEETTRVILNVQQPGTGTRAEGNSVTAHTVAFTNGYVYFVDGAGTITDVFTIVTGTPDVENREVNITAGAVSFDVVSGKSQHVYIFGNVPAFTHGVGDNISDVLSENITINSQTNSVTASNVSKVTLYGKTNYAIDHSVTPSLAEVTVAPIGSRIEIKEFKAVKVDDSTPTSITTYRIDGIFMNNFYNKSNANGTKTTTGDLIYYSKEENAQAPQYFVSGAGLYSAANLGITYNADEASGIGTYDAGTKVYAPSTSGNVWAYNLLAPAQGEFPHIVVRLSNLNTEIVAGNQLRWMTVTNFINKADDSNITTFEPGKIYKIESFEFNETNLEVSPEMNTTSALVTVTLATWEEVSVKPW